MVETYSFGEWVKQRRKAQRLTQRELAMKAACAVATIKKIEADERRPSVEIAEMLADALTVPQNWRERFVACARGQRPVDTLEGMGTADQTKSSDSLPVAPTIFVGRDVELNEIIRLLSQPDCRLLTLVGPGGIGKTRLAIETAYRLHDTMPDGAVFVPLAPITEATAISAAIIQSLNLAVTSEEQLFTMLRPLQMLLVLDNCEQLGDHSAWFSTLLREVPGIKLLATSRERLQLRDEWVFKVPEMATSQASTLLRKTGERVIPHLEVTDEDAESVCAVVENLPLAVELAAGWLRFMTCEQIVESIQRDVDFLASNMRDIPERHRSIRAVFDYSWKMLSEQEQNALMRLSVFRGGWRAEQAEQVAGANILLLRSLIDKSLVRPTGEGRYDLHELIRQFVAEKLHASGLEAETHERQLSVYTRYVEQLLASFGAHDLGQAFVLAEAELGNCRVAMRWALDHKLPEMALQLLAWLFLPWLRRGHWQEGERWYQEALAAAGDAQTTWVCQGWAYMGAFVAVQGRYPEGSQYIERARKISEHVDDLMAHLAVAELKLQSEFDLTIARQWFERHISLLETWDHPIRYGRMGGAFALFADRLREAGRYDEARAYYRKSIAVSNGRDDGRVGYVPGNLGRIALHEGNLQEAYDLINYSVALMRTNTSRVGIADWTVRLGEVLLYMGNLVEAEINFEESLALYEEIGNIRATTDLASYLAHTSVLQQDWNKAAAFLQQCLPSYNRILEEFRSLASNHSSEYTTPFVDALFCTGLLCANRQQYEEALTIIACATSLREKDPMRPEPQLQAIVEETIAKLRNILGENRYSSSFEKGQPMPIGDVLDYAIVCLL